MNKEDKTILRNIDGEEVDLTQDDLVDQLTFESANFIRRMLAFVIDFILIIVVWYLASKWLFVEIDAFMATLGSQEADFSNPELFFALRDLVWQLFFNLILVWIGAQTLYFTLVPALLGEGRTIGKMLAGIGVVDVKSLNEISPTRLMYREFVLRGLLETLLIIPGIVSILMAFLRSDSRSLHDVLGKTVVIKLDLYEIE